MDELWFEFIGHEGVEVTGKVSVEALVPGNELVTEGKSWHQ